MSASLVGSEMCIRDSPCTLVAAFAWLLTAPPSSVGSGPFARGAWATSLGTSAGTATCGGPLPRPWPAGTRPRTAGR
eukprot:985917-Alexandrium_andersonii.AAC.1